MQNKTAQTPTESGNALTISPTIEFPLLRVSFVYNEKTPPRSHPKEDVTGEPTVPQRLEGSLG
jgi:hypothetical protein